MNSDRTLNHLLLLIYRRALLVAMFAILLAGRIGLVSAHDIQPTKTDPPDGAVLEKSPAKVSIWFPEEVVAEKSSIQVLDGQGKPVDSGKGGVDLNDASHQVLAVSLPALPQGVYTVKWKIGLTDGDSSGGSFQFGVGNVTVPTSAPALAEAPEASPTQPPESTGGLPGGWLVGGGLIVIVVFLAVFFAAGRGQAK